MASRNWILVSGLLAVGFAAPLACQGDDGADAVVPSAGGMSGGSDAGQAGSSAAHSGGTHSTGGTSSDGGSANTGGSSGGIGGVPADPWGTLVPPLWTKATIPHRDLKNCDIFTGNAARIPWPAASWEPRGAYDAFVVKPPETTWMYQGFQPAWTMARHQVSGVDDLYLHLRHGGKHQGDEAIGLDRILRVSDLSTVGVLANRFTDANTVVCGDGSYRESALDVPYGGLIEGFVARFHPASSQWSFAPMGDAFSGTHGFDSDVPAQLFVSSSGQVLRLNPTDGTSSAIRTNTTTRVPASLGDTAVWAEGSEVWALRGVDAPTQVVTGGPQYPCSIGLTPEWIFGAGEQTASGVCRSYPTNGRVWRAKRNSEGSTEPIEFGPTITVEAFFSYARGWGDFAGFVATIQGVVEVFIVRFSDWKTWKLDKGSGDSFHSAVWGLDSTFLYVGISHSNLELEELRRYPLASLDTVATVQ